VQRLLSAAAAPRAAAMKRRGWRWRRGGICGSAVELDHALVEDALVAASRPTTALAISVLALATASARPCEIFDLSPSRIEGFVLAVERRRNSSANFTYNYDDEDIFIFLDYFDFLINNDQ